MFIWNHDRSALINANHIVFIGISPPNLEQTDFCLTASLTHGTVILFKGRSRRECEKQLEILSYDISR